MDDLERAMARHFPSIYTKADPRKLRFMAVAAICADGRPTLEQLKMNGLLNAA